MKSILFFLFTVLLISPAISHGYFRGEESSLKRAISFGKRHACMIKTEEKNGEKKDKVMCWGDNEEGQAQVPLSLPSDRQYKQVIAGEKTSCVMTESSVHCWGQGAKELADFTDIHQPLQIAVGDQFVCAIDGTELKCWGAKSAEIIANKPKNLLQPKYIAASGDKMCAVNDVGAYCWSRWSPDMYSLNEFLRDKHRVRAITLFEDDSLCVLNDDRIECSEFQSPLFSEPALDFVIQDNLSCVLRGDGVTCQLKDREPLLVLPGKFKNIVSSPDVLCAWGRDLKCVGISYENGYQGEISLELPLGEFDISPRLEWAFPDRSSFTAYFHEYVKYDLYTYYFSPKPHAPPHTDIDPCTGRGEECRKYADSEGKNMCAIYSTGYSVIYDQLYSAVCLSDSFKVEYSLGPVGEVSAERSYRTLAMSKNAICYIQGRGRDLKCVSISRAPTSLSSYDLGFCNGCNLLKLKNFSEVQMYGDRLYTMNEGIFRVQGFFYFDSSEFNFLNVKLESRALLDLEDFLESLIASPAGGGLRREFLKILRDYITQEFPMNVAAERNSLWTRHRLLTLIKPLIDSSSSVMYSEGVSESYNDYLASAVAAFPELADPQVPLDLQTSWLKLNAKVAQASLLMAEEVAEVEDKKGLVAARILLAQLEKNPVGGAPLEAAASALEMQKEFMSSLMGSSKTSFLYEIYLLTLENLKATQGMF